MRGDGGTSSGQGTPAYSMASRTSAGTPLPCITQQVSAIRPPGPQHPPQLVQRRDRFAHVVDDEVAGGRILIRQVRQHRDPHAGLRHIPRFS
jgi:hypothetical protein